MVCKDFDIVLSMSERKSEGNIYSAAPLTHHDQGIHKTMPLIGRPLRHRAQ